MDETRVYSNEPSAFDQPRVARMAAVYREIEGLHLPLIPLRKLNGIYQGLTMQMEDGGDNPGVNKLLLDALSAAVRHQVSEEQAHDVLQAIDRFERSEVRCWAEARAQHPKPPDPSTRTSLDKHAVD